MGKISKLALATAAMVAAGVGVTNNPSAEDVNSQIEKRAGISQTTSQNRTEVTADRRKLCLKQCRSRSHGYQRMDQTAGDYPCRENRRDGMHRYSCIY